MPELGDELPTNEEIIAEIEADNEKDYFKQLKQKNKGFLLEGLSLMERERIARHIVKLLRGSETKHNELCDKIDEYDDVYRMKRKEVPGSSGDMPNYRSPLSTGTHETVHSHIMNVFFSPKDTIKVVPTEEGDVSKVKKLSTFANWSGDNELSLFEQCDRLFHYSEKTGESPYLMHWVKEYGTEIKREMVMNPADPSQPLFDPDTQEPIFQEVDEQKLLYNAPRLEPFSRKDYIQPINAIMDKLPEWEMMRRRMSYDEFLREQLQGKMYPNSIEEIEDWSGEGETKRDDSEGDQIPIGDWNNEFIHFYGRLRVQLIKNDDESEADEFEELEDEFIAVVHIQSETLCQLRVNKFPLKMRPIGVDYFIPDDEGRREGIGIYEFMDSLQTSYDALFNQYIWGTVQSNNPFGFFSPLGNMRDEAIKIQNGHLFPTSDPNAINIVKIPPPDQSLQVVLELIRFWAQFLFGISDFTSGLESKIDPDAPAKKAEIVVAQGNVRLNMIIKRKNKTLQDIFKRWFLLYQANMPPNKFMRIAGEGENPWKFQPISLEDFALKSLPDFELTGNILNANKSFEANKAIAIYNVLVSNPFFSPQTLPGIKALHSLTKWVIDKLDETGLSRFIPPAPAEVVHTPEEENARFLQGDFGEPTPEEDHVNHMRTHNQMIVDPSVPDEIKEKIVEHNKKHAKLLQDLITQQTIFGNQQPTPEQFGGNGNGQPAQGPVPGQATPGATNRVFQEQGQPTGLV